MKDTDLRAVVMAGGRGTRLRPLTDRIPKPLSPIGDESAVSVILDMLSRSGVRRAALTLMYKGEAIEKELGAVSHGISLSYIKETKPLGTAGSVKGAADFLSGCGDFIVASGDAVCDFELSDALACHREKGALATLLLARVEDPGEYGTVRGNFDKNGRGEITAFIEKPCAAQAYSDLVNTGIYVLSEKILDLIPAGTPFDFARDLFPTLIGKGLYGYTADGYWCDIGDIKAYRRCLFDAAAGKIKTAARCRADGDGNIIGKDCSIAASAKISNSILHAGVKVGENSRVSDSILCENSLVEEDAIVEAGAVIGAGSVVCANSRVTGAKLAEGSIVTVGSRIEEKGGASLGFHRARVTGLDKNDVPFLAAALLEETKDKKAGIMWQGERPAAADAFQNVLGECAALLGEGQIELASFAAKKFDLAFAAFIKNEEEISFFGSDGLPVSHRFERSVISNYKKCEPKKADSLPCDMTQALRGAYLDELMGCVGAGESLSGVYVSLSENAEASPLSHAFGRLGASPREPGGEGYHVELRENGCVGTLYDYRNGECTLCGPSHIAALLILHTARPGERVALPFYAPKILDLIAETVGASTERYPENDSDERGTATEIKFILRDSAAALISLLYLIKLQNSTLKEECRKLPEFAFVKKVMNTKERDPSSLMRSLMEGDFSAGDGIRLEYPTGSLCFIPYKENEVIIACDAKDKDDADEVVEKFSERYGLYEK